jgi:N6-adenosine-specific RNA methylase IME4
MQLKAAIQGQGAPYSVIYADPSWHFKTYSQKGAGRSASVHYDTMTLNEIKALDVASIASKDAVLFLWVLQSMLPHALELIDAWGFKYKTIGFVWVKMRGKQAAMFCGQTDVRRMMGYYTRAGSEICLIATRGKGLKRLSKGEYQVVLAPLREHSRKPDEVAQAIERLYGDVPRLEMFARTRRDGWDVFGNQVDKFEQFDQLEGVG